MYNSFEASSPHSNVRYPFKAKTKQNKIIIFIYSVSDLARGTRLLALNTAEKPNVIIIRVALQLLFVAVVVMAASSVLVVTRSQFQTVWPNLCTLGR